MKKKVLAGLLATVFAVSVLAGCGSKAQDSAADSSAEATETEEAGAQDADAAATEDAADEAAPVESKGTITVAASATPHAEILEAAKAILAEQGWICR